MAENRTRYNQRNKKKINSQKHRSSMQVNYGVYPGGGPRPMETKKKPRVNIPIILMMLLLVVGSIVGGFYAYSKWTSEDEVVVNMVDFGDPTLPQIAFLEEGYEVNTLVGYTKQMDILTMRDTISPLTPQGNLELVLKPYENEITQVSYQVLSSDGTKILKEEVITEWDEEQITLKLSNVIPDVEESLLEVILTLSDGSQVYYYTRIITYGTSNLSDNLSFVEAFHDSILAQASATEQGETSDTEISDTGTSDTATSDTATSQSIELASYLTSSEDTANGSLQYVTMASSESDVTWGTMSPVVLGDVKWSITECSSLFISVLLEYQVESVNEETGVTEQYYVEEFFRVGYSSSTASVQLKQYRRTIDQVFDINQVDVALQEIDLGITGDETKYKINNEETAIAFVQERELYLYVGSTNELVQVFTLEEAESSDARYLNDEYGINILSVDENGNVSFVVYGYMNRGTNEGEVGTGIYYYDVATQILEAKAFVSSTTSFAVGEHDMSHGMYYSSGQNKIYMIAQGAFYEVSLDENTQTKLAEDMTDDSYVMSEDGKLIAYLDGNDCVILEFETGETNRVAAEGDSQIMPLGFLEHDLIYGLYSTDDTLMDETESEITPMSQIVICDESGEVLKTYENDNQYIKDISVIDNMITMTLVEKEEGVYVYIGQDVITNNQVTVTENGSITTYDTEQKQEQKKLSFFLNFDTEMDLDDLKVIVAQLAYSEDTIHISYESSEVEEMYYAYAYGELQVQSTTASDAIMYASDNVGAVVNEDMTYVWRSGSRDLTFTVSNYSSYVSRMSGGESAIEIVAESANQNVVFYTGCTTEQMCYIINQEQVIAAKLENGSWVLLVGYTGSTMYYLNENGAKVSVGMETLDSQVIELVGDGRF